jgi:hypothetical protein
MALRRLAAVVPVIAALALTAPVAGASAQTTPAPGSPGSMIACYPEPAFCGPNGAPWYPFFPLQLTPPSGGGLGGLPFGPGPVQVPGFPIP